MEEDEDDDIYAPEESTVQETAGLSRNGVDDPTRKNLDNGDEDEEEGEEVEEEGSDSVCLKALIALPLDLTNLAKDIDIITERKGGPEPKNENM